MKMLISYSISDLFTLICIALLVSGCAFSAILCFICTTKEQKSVPLKAENKDSFSLEKIAKAL